MKLHASSIAGLDGSTRQSSGKPRRGAVSALQALMAGSLPLFLVSVQDWYVDVQAPGCASGLGSQVDPFCNLQDAVDAAVEGDTIHIASGTYFESLTIAKDLDLIGTSGAGLTILDGSQTAVVVSVSDGSRVGLKGLTLTNGFSDLGRVGLQRGITRGAGLVCSYNSHVLLESSSVTANLGTGIYGYGGAWVTLVDSNVSQNNSAGAGGIHMDNNNRLTMVGSTVSQNTGSDAGGVFFAGVVSTSQRVGGAGLGPRLVLQESTVSDNCALSGAGGGISAGCAAVVRINNSTIRGNVANDHGGGFYGSGVDLELVNTLVAENTAALNGGGIFLSACCGGWGSGSGSIMAVTNSTIVSNGASVAGGGVWLEGGAGRTCGPFYTVGEVRNSIVWGNLGGQLELGPLSSAGMRYCDIEGGWSGTGNFAADPFFVDPVNGDFGLSSGSPCIDAGDNHVLHRGIRTDVLGQPRFVDDPATIDTGVSDFLPLVHLPSGNRAVRPVVDIGAYEYQ